jgi:hypothetical protein
MGYFIHDYSSEGRLCSQKLDPIEIQRDLLRRRLVMRTDIFAAVYE